ncbi:hypothetical protein BST22_09390 [Mycolicibacterium chubuense]|uniref:Low molecular weight antigen MTB12-like C-terminal domain-containing protein n=1 Tax=Mycolicibacterium chubuense TaxID=1800 RepID=A0A0J6WGF8_MYCCU|nr:hypothetical protein [Mycolicibacterium chubuense]KMO82350.1 hypothetical protein MCHUDSM44219_01600 [Mycolicibacterium chubuense]ORA53356.1 hypothetical protein BST22_09390 [Mycolicibacterium chubuense]SPX96460.1 low molecular weight antigen CFP2 [Mycolicibacterium chubuense]
MTLKSLFTSFTAGTAAAAVAGAAAVGVTSIALGAGVASAEPVVVNAPLAPAPELAGPLTQTVNVLGSGGSFSGKQAYVQDLGRIGGIGVSAKYNSAVEKGYLPLTATVADVDQNGNVATANVTATLPNGVTRTMPLSFVQGPSPTGWQLSQQSLFTLAGMLG